MNENGPMPGFSVAQSASLKKKLRSLRWKPDAVNLPRVLRSSTDRLPAIAPAEVELR